MFVAAVSPERTTAAMLSEVAGPLRPTEQQWDDGEFAIRFAASERRADFVGDDIAVFGRAVLDDLPEASTDSGCRQASRDLGVIGARYKQEGLHAFRSFSGEFAALVWDRAARTLVVARDAFGLARLFIRSNGDTLFVSDVPDVLSSGTLDLGFVAEFIATGRPSSFRTIWSSVAPASPGRILTWKAGRKAVEEFWAVPPRSVLVRDGREAASELRRLLHRAVRNYVGSSQQTWADLSGGLDSSSVVCIAALAARHEPNLRLGGTVTFVEHLGIDETEYVDDVLGQYELRNYRIENPSPWCSDGEPPPITSQPTRDYPYYARDRLVAKVLSAAGATSLLSGVGPDLYLPLGTAHITDLIWRGRLREAASQVMHWSYGTNTSFWRTSIREVLLPIGIRGIYECMLLRQTRIPAWLCKSFVSCEGYREYVAGRNLVVGNRRQRSRAITAQRFEELGARLADWRWTPGCKIRHPLLYRPLVDFCLALPHEFATDVRSSKLLLRMALSGILPDSVRNRAAKGTLLLPRMCWAFRRERELLRRLLKTSILAELGCIEPKRMLAAMNDHAAGSNEDKTAVNLFHALSLETWLWVKTGRYTVESASRQYAGG